MIPIKPPERASSAIEEPITAKERFFLALKAIPEALEQIGGRSLLCAAIAAAIPLERNWARIARGGSMAFLMTAALSSGTSAVHLLESAQIESVKLKTLAMLFMIGLVGGKIFHRAIKNIDFNRKNQQDFKIAAATSLLYFLFRNQAMLRGLLNG